MSWECRKAPAAAGAPSRLGVRVRSCAARPTLHCHQRFAPKLWRVRMYGAAVSLPSRPPPHLPPNKHHATGTTTASCPCWTPCFGI